MNNCPPDRGFYPGFFLDGSQVRIEVVHCTGIPIRVKYGYIPVRMPAQQLPVRRPRTWPPNPYLPDRAHAAHARRRRRYVPRTCRADAPGDGAAIAVDVLGVVGQSECARAGQRLRGERPSLSSITSRSETFQAQAAAISFSTAGIGSDPHDARQNAGGGEAQHPGPGLEPVFLHRRAGGQQQRRRAIVDARGVSRRHRTVGPHHGLQFREAFQRGIGAQLLVAVDYLSGRAFRAGHRYRHDLFGEHAGLLSPRCPLLRAQRKGVLRLARHMEVGRDVLAGFPAWNRRRREPSSAH